MYTVPIDQKNKEAFLPLMDPFFAEALGDPDVVALGAVEKNDEAADDEAAGALLCRLREDWADIIWLYADPRFRGRGIGRMLLLELISALLKEPEIRGAFAEYEDTKENISLTRLFSQSAFSIEDDSKAIYAVTLADVAESPLWKRDLDDSRVFSLEDADEAQWKAFQIELMENDQPVAAALPIDRRDFHPRLSAVYASEGKIRGVVLMRENEGAPELSYAHVLPGNEAALGAMLHKVGRLAMAAFPPSTPIRFTPVNGSGEGIAEKLFPALEKTPFRRAVLFTSAIARSSEA
ncbi:MAG: GNAT family N-acetyltransferase [Clostridiales Family XIII bacterium]|jgi:GNAT superfamily N-acetyltransferase|nr:GNAT family N-acetyltransferase [Clostridiales Family XIII bacterium]